MLSSFASLKLLQKKAYLDYLDSCKITEPLVSTQLVPKLEKNLDKAMESHVEDLLNFKTDPNHTDLRTLF